MIFKGNETFAELLGSLAGILFVFLLCKLIGFTDYKYTKVLMYVAFFRCAFWIAKYVMVKYSK